MAATVGGLTKDVETPPADGECVGDYTIKIPGYVPPTSASTVASPNFTLATGTYLPTMTASTRWFINRTHDLLDGEQFTTGFVRVKLVRTRAGVQTTVATCSSLWNRCRPRGV